MGDFATLPSGISAADEELVSQLRNKYMPASQAAQGVSNDEAAMLSRAQLGEYSTEEIPVSSGRVRQTTDASVALCITCHGTGQVVEEYGFRRLESTCSTCLGRGCNVTRNGEVVPESADPPVRIPHDGHPRPPRPDADEARQLRQQKETRCRAELVKIKKKLAKYQAELDVAALAAEAPTDAEGRRLHHDLVTQLEKTITDLQKQLVKREKLITGYDALQESGD